MSPLFLILLLEILGAIATIYLIGKRQAGEKPVCPIGDNCHTVLSSKYNKMFFVHNDELGLVFYLVAIFFAVALLNNFGPIELIEKIFGLMLAAASTLSVVFVYLQWRVIRAWCFWCVFSAVNVWVITGIHLYFYFLP